MPKSWIHPLMADVEHRIALASEEIDKYRTVMARARAEHEEVSARLYDDLTQTRTLEKRRFELSELANSCQLNVDRVERERLRPFSAERARYVEMEQRNNGQRVKDHAPTVA